MAQKEFDKFIYPHNLLSNNTAPVAQLDRALDYESDDDDSDEFFNPS